MLSGNSAGGVVAVAATTRGGGSTGGAVVMSSLTASSPVTLTPPVLSEFQSPSRPNHGVEGQTIQLRANHFQVRVPRGFIHHYDVSIQPDKCPRRVNRLLNVFCALFPGLPPFFVENLDDSGNSESGQSPAICLVKENFYFPVNY